MSLSNIGKWPKEPLEAYFARGEHWFMIKVIKAVNAALGDREVFCLVDRVTLALVSQPNPDAFWWVRLSPMTPIPAVKLACVGPDRFMPWPNALVEWVSESPEDATEKLLKMIDYSDGWTDPERLTRMR